MRYKRHLPHWQPEGAALHVTWRLAKAAPGGGGPKWLGEPRIAQIVVDALHFGEEQKHFYQLYAYVVMPNHVHMLIAPCEELPVITRWLKGRTARVANRILGRTHQPFWQDESFDHWIRSAEEFSYVARYIELNPVRAGLAVSADARRYSSATADRPQNTMACPTRPYGG